MRPRRWTIDQLKEAASSAKTIRQLLTLIGLRPAGGNYAQIYRELENNKISTDHFVGHGWSKGLKLVRTPRLALEAILVEGSTFQSAKLKKRLFASGLKKPQCELCGWAVRSPDGRLPLELDHINGCRSDHRLSNLRILCPNCHSLQPTHRGLNIRKRQR